MGRVRFSSVVKAVLCLLAATATVIACGWMGTNQSVRFNAYETEREMGRLPPLPTLANGKTELRLQWMSEADYDDPASGYSMAEQRAKETDELWQRAEAAEKAGDLDLTRSLLRDYVSRTALIREAWFEPKDRQQRRNSALDRLDALAALDQGAGPSAVQSYLAARHAYDANLSTEDIKSTLDAVPKDSRLSDNVAYLRAALLYRDGKPADAARAFAQIAQQYTQSEKREVALFMAAVATMKTSHSFTATSGDEAHLHAGDRPTNSNRYSSDPHQEEPPPLAECCDERWGAAHDAFKFYLAKYPHGRYASDAHGWIAYLLLRANDRAGALVEYYRLLGDEHDRNARLEAAFSLALVRHHATEDEMKRVEAALEKEPSAALAYAYHDIYNYAIDPGCPLQYNYPENSWDAQSQEERKNRLQRAELTRVAAFASRLLKRYPRAEISGGFALRLAAANLELGENRMAEEQATRALSLDLKGAERARALWLKGVAEHRLHDYANARQTLSTLLTENPQGELTEGARRLLAMVAEDAGDIDAALEQYLALRYDTDVAYFIDVLMTPAQLAGFIERHPNFEKRDEFLYALGVRYMRERRWDEARAAFARVQTVGEEGDRYDYDSPDSACHPPPGFNYRCHDPKDWDKGPGVTARLLLSDLKTIDDLERLERAAEAAQGDEAKAEALYQLASYQYESSTLLFYNPIAWQGVRHYELNDLQSQNRFRAPGEAARLWREMQEHEPIARALSIYLEIVSRYPQTRAARDALYTAAVCHERLSDYNEYWRSMYAHGLHAGERMVTYADVKAAYPDYQLPRGTTGWEPVTRTVEGGTGWDAPPKPQPRPSWSARMQYRIGKLWNWLARFWDEHARHWLAVALAFLAALFASYFAGRARKQLREQLTRPRPKLVKQKHQWLAAYRRGNLLHLAQTESRRLIRRARHQILRLALSARGRKALALNIGVHALLVVLIALMAHVMLSG